MRVQWSYGAIIILSGITVILLKLYSLFFSGSGVPLVVQEDVGISFLISWLVVAAGIIMIFIGISMMKAANKKEASENRGEANSHTHINTS